MNLSILKKIRCRFLSQKTGKPVKGVVANLSVQIKDGSEKITLPYATLVSDVTGYMSFDLKPFFEIVQVHKVFISAPKYNLMDFDLLAHINTEHDKSVMLDPKRKFEDIIVEDTSDDNKDLENSLDNVVAAIKKKLYPSKNENSRNSKQTPCIVFPIYLSEQLNTSKDDCCSGCGTSNLLSIQSPDSSDYEASPFSFVSPPSINTGNACENLMPSTLPVQQFHFYKIIVRNNNVTTSDITDIVGASLRSVEDRIDDVDITSPLSQLTLPRRTIKFGEILDYKQSWYSLGHSLGEIKYSLPLAPGESTQLAVIEWSRQDTASRKDGVTATEFLDHDSRRDRSIEDTVNAVLSETQEGSSFMAGTSGAATIPLTYVDLSFNHAIGGSISHTSGNRDVEGESLQDLHDRVRQTSASIRSLTSTVIVQSAQAEGNTLQTRRVANHNHCHALTVQYYEVLRHYRLSTVFSGKRSAVLIPFSIFSFTADTALRFRQALEQMLLDPSLKDCFEALLRLQMPELYPVRSNTIALNGLSTNDTNETATGVIVKTGDIIYIKAVGQISYWNPSAGEKLVFFDPDGSTALPQANDTQDWSAGKFVRMFSLCFKIGNGEWQQGGKDVKTFADADGEIFLVANDVKKTFADNTGKWIVNVRATTADVGQQVKTTSVANENNSGPITKTEHKTTTYPTIKVDGNRRGDIYKRTEYGKKSGIILKKDDEVSFTADGKIYVGDWGNPGYTPDGHNTSLGGATAVAGTAQGLRLFSLMFRIGNEDWQQGGSSVNFTASNNGELIFMLNEGNYDDNSGEWNINDLKVTREVTTETPSTVSNPPISDQTTKTATQSSSETASNYVQDKLCALRLLKHLNSNQGYYNRTVWMMMDAVERRLYLEAALSMVPEILNTMDDFPLAVTGNYLAFPYNLPREDLESAFRSQPGETREDIVCFPTRGLFAEAQLGHCNSCEERDITRMWNWNEMTTETPPDISGIAPGPKGSVTDLTSAQLPANVIQITTPQNAPDPTGLANALTLLGNGNAFRDMSGLNQVSTLLGQLAKLSSEANIKALAITAKKQVDDMNNPGESGSGGGTGSGTQNQKTSPTERYDNLTVAKKEAAAMGLNEEETAQYIKDLGKKNNLTGADAITSSDGGFVPDAGSSSKPVVGYFSLSPIAAKKKLIDEAIEQLGIVVDLKDANYLKALVKQAGNVDVYATISTPNNLQFFIVRGGAEGFLPLKYEKLNADEIKYPTTVTDGSVKDAIWDDNDLLIVFDAFGNLIDSAILQRPLFIPETISRESTTAVYNAWNNKDVLIYYNNKNPQWIKYVGIGVADGFRNRTPNKITIDIHKREESSGCIFIYDEKHPDINLVDRDKVSAYEPPIINKILEFLNIKDSTKIKQQIIGKMHMIDIGDLP